MRAADITSARKQDPWFAVSVPRSIHSAGLGRTIVRARVESLAGRKANVQVHEDHHCARSPVEVFTRGSTKTNGSVHVVSLVHVLAPWGDYVLERDHAEAIAMDRNRTDRLRYEAERKARVERIEGFLPAFDGVMVPAEALSSANFDRPPVDLGEYLRQVFIRDHAKGTTFGWETFEAIAERITALQSEALDNLSTWSQDERTDSGRPAVETLPPKRSVDEVLEALDAKENSNAQ